MPEYEQLCERIDALYLAGDREELFAAIHQLAMRRLRGDKDASQDATLRVLSGLDTYQAQGAFSRWVNSLITCTRRQDRRARSGRNEHVVQIGAFCRTREDGTGCETEGDASDRLSLAALAEDDLFWNDYFRPFERVEQLQPTIIDPFIAQVASAILEGHHLVDIASTLNVTLAALKGRLKRFRQQLHKINEQIPGGEVGTEYDNAREFRSNVTPFPIGSGKHNRRDWNRSASDNCPSSLNERRHRLAS